MAKQTRWNRFALTNKPEGLYKRDKFGYHFRLFIKIKIGKTLKNQMVTQQWKLGKIQEKDDKYKIQGTEEKWFQTKPKDGASFQNHLHEVVQNQAPKNQF